MGAILVFVFLLNTKAMAEDHAAMPGPPAAAETSRPVADDRPSRQTVVPFHYEYGPEVLRLRIRSREEMARKITEALGLVREAAPKDARSLFAWAGAGSLDGKRLTLRVTTAADPIFNLRTLPKDAKAVTYVVQEGNENEIVVALLVDRLMFENFEAPWMERRYVPNVLTKTAAAAGREIYGDVQRFLETPAPLKAATPEENKANAARNWQASMAFLNRLLENPSLSEEDRKDVRATLAKEETRK